MTTTLSLILGSAAVAALVSSLVNAIGNWLAKRADLERQDMERAFKMAQLRHDQLVRIREWSAEDGKAVGISFWDPFMTVIDYRGAMKEFRKTGRWEKGEEQLRRFGSSRGSST